jgi:hypothetical protein
MSTRTSLFAIVLTLAAASSCLTVTTRVTVSPSAGGDVCREEPGKIPCDHDCDSAEECEAPNNCCRGLCDRFHEH